MRLPFARVLAPALFLAFAFAAESASAQTFRGGILGTVTDQTDAAMPGVVVTATNIGTGLSRSVTTDASGNYYLLRAAARRVQRVGCVCRDSRRRRPRACRWTLPPASASNLQLHPGGVQESVEVTARSPLVDTTRNVQGGTIEGASRPEIPLNGRDFTKLLTLVPGAAADPSGINDSPGSFGLFSINGNRGRSNNYLLDGTDMNDGYRNLPAINEAGVFGTPATVLPIDAVAEFPVLSGVEAEYGRNAGAIVNIVTQVGHEHVDGQRLRVPPRRRAGRAELLQHAADAEERLPQQPVRRRRSAARSSKDRTFYFFGLRRAARAWRGARPGARRRRQAELDQAIAANGGVVNPVTQGILQRSIPGRRRTRHPDANGNNLQATTLFDNRRGQPDRRRSTSTSAPAIC